MLKSTPTLGLSTDGHNFLWEAAEQGSLHMITLLVAAGSSIHARGRTNAKVTITEENSHRLLSSPVSLTAKETAMNDTALFAAIRNNQLLAVQLLLDLGAESESLDLGNKSGTYLTALGFAVLMGHKDIVILLLDRGAKLNPQIAPRGKYEDALPVKNIEQPLSLAMRSKKKWDDSLSPLLINRGADVNHGFNMFKPLIQAIEGRITQPVTELLAAGAKVDCYENQFNTELFGPSPLQTAIKLNVHKYNSEIIEELLKNGADVNYSTDDADQPLILAIRQKDQNVVDQLLHWRAKPNPQGERQTSPLLEAVRVNEPDIVRLLLRNGANTREKVYRRESGIEKRRITALELAQSLRRRRIQKILKEWGKG